MKRIQKGRILFMVVFLLSVVGLRGFAKTEVNNLTCEYRTNPVGIDVEQPRLAWKIVSNDNNVLQSAYEIRVARNEADLKAGRNLLWSSGRITSAQSVHVRYNGPALNERQRVYWQVRIWDHKNKPTAWSVPAYWELGLLAPKNWIAEWIYSSLDQPQELVRPCTYFRKEFSLGRPVQSARIYATANGLYQLSLNGEKVGDERFTPGWTSYNKRQQYQTYDVTNQLQSNNAIGAVVGDGWYRGTIGWGNNRNRYGHHTALLFQLHVQYTDGSQEVINSDHSWLTTTGPILYSDIYNGETYDANLEQNGWDQPGFPDEDWRYASVLDYSKSHLVAQQGLPVKVIDEIKPVNILKTPKGELVFDMGQNMVGWVRLQASGKRGDQVTLKFAEVLDKEGNFYTDNLRSAKATDYYTFKGGGVELFEPHFTFHGFRYVLLEGFHGTPDLNTITGVVIHSDMEPTGNFSCSDSLINRLQHNIQWGQKGNFLDVPTDCPQRDERLGWTGDAQVFFPTAAFNFQVAPFFTKWMADVAADQQPDGRIPHVVPDVLNGDGGSSAWADAAIVIPWQMYLIYGDKQILEVQYPSMKAWVDFMANRAGEGLIWRGDYHFGDWLAFATTRSDYPGATTEKDLIATAYFRYSSGVLAEIAALLGKEEDASRYQILSEKIKTAFIHEFVTPAGRLVSITQTAYALALAFSLLPEDLVSAAAQHLAHDVRKFGHLTTGFVGTPLLCATLSDHGYHDLACMLLNRKEYPSWLYPVTQGATTIWERWDGQKPDGTFQDVGMNSFNHYAYGAIGDWLYRYVAGLNPDPQNPGYKHIIFKPQPGGGLSYARAEFESMYGTVVSYWKLEAHRMIYEVGIPANTTATVILPNAGLTEVTMNGQKPKGLADKAPEQMGSHVKIELGSGKYLFEYPCKNE